MVRKLMLVSGIASSVLYLVADVVGAAVYTGYSYFDQTISELSAIGAPSRSLVVALLAFYPPLVLGFALGILLVANGKRSLVACACLLGVYAIACVPFAPMHTREILAAGGETWTDTMHLVMTGIDSLLLLSIIVLGAIAFGRAFRWYSIVTVVVMLGCGGYTAAYGADVAADRSTPWIGITERVTVFGSMIWLATLAGRLLRSHHRDASLRASIQTPTLTYFALAHVIT